MKLAITMAAVGFVGTLVFLGGYVIFPIAINIDSPWPLIIGVCFFIVFAIGMTRLRRYIRKNSRR
jgi:purine-cytosine permease-like protein